MEPLNEEELNLGNILLSNNRAASNFFLHSSNPRFLNFLLGDNQKQRNLFQEGVIAEEDGQVSFMLPMAYLVRIAETLQKEKDSLNSTIYQEYTNYIAKATYTVIKSNFPIPTHTHPFIIIQTIQIITCLGIENFDSIILSFITESIEKGWMEHIIWYLCDLLKELIKRKNNNAIILLKAIITNLPSENHCDSNIYYSLEELLLIPTMLEQLSTFCGENFIFYVTQTLAKLLYKKHNKLNYEKIELTCAENASVNVKLLNSEISFSLPYVRFLEIRAKLGPIIETKLSTYINSDKDLIIEQIFHFYTYIWNDLSYIFYPNLYANSNCTDLDNDKNLLIFLIKELLTYTLRQQGREYFHQLYNRITTNYNYFIFKRILLYCYSKNFSQTRNEIFNLLTQEKALLLSGVFEADIYYLFETNITSFSKEEKKIIEQLIEAGPYDEVGWLEEKQRDVYKQDSIKNYWKQKQYAAMVSDSLFQEKYQKLKEKNKGKEFFNFRDGVHAKPISFKPLLNDTEALTLIASAPNEYVKQIQNFEPNGCAEKNDFFDEKPSNEGNIEQLQRLAKKYPYEISNSIFRLSLLRPIYIVHLLDGLAQSEECSRKSWKLLFDFIETYIENLPTNSEKQLESVFLAIPAGKEKQQIIRAFVEALPVQWKNADMEANEVVSQIINFLSLMLKDYSFQQPVFIIEGETKKPVSYLESAISTCFGRVLEKLLRIILHNQNISLNAVKDFYTSLLEQGKVEALTFLGYYFADVENIWPKWTQEQANKLIDRAPDTNHWEIFFEGFLKSPFKYLYHYDSMTPHYQKAVRENKEDNRKWLSEILGSFFIEGQDTLQKNSLLAYCYEQQKFDLLNDAIHFISRNLNQTLRYQKESSKEQEKEEETLNLKAKQLWTFIWEKLNDIYLDSDKSAFVIASLNQLINLIPGLDKLEEKEYKHISLLLQQTPIKTFAWNHIISDLLYLVKKQLTSITVLNLGKIYLRIIKKIDFPFPKESHSAIISILKDFITDQEVKKIYLDIKEQYIKKHWLEDFTKIFKIDHID